MKKNLTLLLLFVAAIVSAQTESYHKISLQDKKNVALQSDFYIEKVYDGRQFKDNIGTVQKGAFNKKTFAKFEKPLEQELQDYFAVIYPKSSEKRAISIRISEIYVSELTRSFSETGYGSVVFDVIEEKDGVPFIVGRFSASEESNGMDVTGKHDDRIKLCLSKCFGFYAHLPAEKKETFAFEATPVINSKLPASQKRGIYLSYADVLNNTPQDTINFVITGTAKKAYLTHMGSGKVLLDYYAVSDGQNLFLNVSKYAKDKYYAKTEVIGNKFYVDDVVYNENTSMIWGAMFGIVGMIIASSDDNSGWAPMLIDSYTGKPEFLTNNRMKELLEPYPEAQKAYKKSEKTSEDKKRFVKQIIAGSQSSAQ